MHDNKKFKNVLIINNYSMFEHTPVGITIKSIFNDWPENNKFEIYRYSTSELKLNDIKSFKLPENNLPIDNIIRSLLGKKVKMQESNSPFQISLSDKVPFKQKLKIMGKYVAESLFICKKSSETFKKIEDFNPQVIYTIGESLFALKASLYFSNKFNIPVVVHYMDNWRETIYPPTGVLKIFNYLFLRNLKKVENKMERGLVISPKMKKDYSLLNKNVNYSVLLNSVDKIQSNQFSQPGHLNKEIFFTYIGGLHLNRWESLLKLENCICELNKQGIPSILYIYTPEKDEMQFSDKFNPDYTKFAGYLPHNKVSQAYKDADILVHVESFNSQVVKYTKYSLSTKIPECMASGKPILCYAPSLLAVSEYINNTETGISVDNQNDLLNAAFKLAMDGKLRHTLGQKGISTVKNSHTQKVALKILTETL